MSAAVSEPPVERIARWRRVLLVAITFGWLLWQAAVFANGLALAPHDAAILSLIGTAALVFWLAGFALLMFMMRRAANNRRLRDALEDELTKSYRTKAFYEAFFMLLAALIVLTGAVAIWPMPALPVLQCLMAVAVVFPILRFSWLDSREG